jgi:hypothetical protein
MIKYREPILVDHRLLKIRGSPGEFVSKGINNIVSRIPTNEYIVSGFSSVIRQEETIIDKLRFIYNSIIDYYFYIIKTRLFWNLLGISILVCMILFFIKVSNDFPEDPYYSYYDNYREPPRPLPDPTAFNY